MQEKLNIERRLGVREEAKALVNKFKQVASFHDMSDVEEEARFCAICCVEEIIKSKTKPSTNYTIKVLEDIQYWKDILTEIENL